MKILKFLHASNFQLHIPVTCWPAPVPVERTFPESGKSSADGVSHGTEQFLSLALEHTKSLMLGTAFPELPQSLTEECIDAPWKSAERVFDLALEQNVDFLLLTGDVLQPDLTGPRGLVFLTNQFRRLEERGISVYWKLEQSLEEWLLPDFQFPKNVFLFPSNETHIKKFRLADSTKNIFIASWDSLKPDFSRYDFTKLPNEKLPPAQTIALCPNEQTFTEATNNHSKRDSKNQKENTQESINKKSKSKRELSFNAEVTKTGTPLFTAAYVGLTELQNRMTSKLKFQEKTLDGEIFQTVCHSPGPIQYRSPDLGGKQWQQVQTGGVTIVQLDIDGDLPASLQFFPTEILAWTFLEKQIPETVQNWENLHNWLVQELNTTFSVKTENAQNSLNANRTFVFWHLIAEKNSQIQLLRTLFKETFQNGGFQTNDDTQKLSFLLKILRNAGEQLITQPWTVAITPECNGLIPPSWSQGESMLHDFLGLVQLHLKNASPEDSLKGQNLSDFTPHTLDLKEFLTENQRKNGLAIFGELNHEDECAFLELASVLGADAFAEMQEGTPQK